ncbi:hypothetical protein F5884DRAFT_873743 [Xylogone sp. PMI_703]|nr:hypothetical protein F5884DRAFT_873743 [Xylogone sp. PMI_703]
MSSINTTLPKGSWVLVTGVTGYIASHVALEFLKLGYKVRGTVRDPEKARWLTEETFAPEASAGSFEISVVPDMAIDGAFDEAVKGVSAVAHVATIATYDSNPNNVIPQTIAGAVNALKAASRESSVKQFVYTSTVGASAFPIADVAFHVDQDTWNDSVVAMAWAPPPYEPSRGMIVYAGGKVETERAVWKFVQEQKPGFTVNTVNPFTVFGRILNSKQKPSTAGWVLDLYRGEIDQIKHVKALNYVNARDVALLHVAAVLDPEVKNQRIHAWGAPFNWNDLLAIMRKLRPAHKFIDDIPNLGQMLGTVDDSLGLKLLKKWNGQAGWTSLEQGIRENIEGLA